MKLETGADTPTAGAGALYGILALAVARLWIVPLPSSLLLDEFGTWWVSGGPPGEILARARLFPQSVPYAAIVRVARAIGGSGEIALRLPSLLAAAAAAWVLFRLGRELFDRESGLFAAAIFSGYPLVCFAAGDARPYAFGVLSTTGALWALVRWLDRGRVREALVYVALASVSVYFQYLFATMFVVHALYAWRRWRRRGPVGLASLAAAAGGIALLTAPAALLVREIGRDRAVHAFEPVPGAAGLFLAVVPTGVIAALLGSVLIGAAFGVVRFRRGEMVGPAAREGAARSSGDAVYLSALCAVLPAVLLFALSRATGTSVFVPRYMICMIPGQALLLARALRAVEPARGRTAIVAGYLVIQILARGTRIAHGSENWRGAAAAVAEANGVRPVLLSGTYTESRDVGRVRSAEHAAYLRAPLEFYPAGGPTALLPLLAGADAEAYAAALLDAAPAFDGGFALIERSSRYPSWEPWLERRLAPKGFRARRVWDRGNPAAWVFERAAPVAPAPR